VKSTPRTRQLDESLKEVLAGILETEVTDPRLEFVTITGVNVSKDLRYARVWVTTHGDAARYEAMMAGLASAKGRIRKALAERTSIKYVPELTFELDDSVDEGQRIQRALRAEAKAERKRARKREAAGMTDAHEGVDRTPGAEPAPAPGVTPQRGPGS
jgi:ribosome-binding factor A